MEKNGIFPMVQKVYSSDATLGKSDFSAIAEFLHLHLGIYGDEIEDIEACLKYAMDEQRGGFIIMGTVNGQMAGVVVVNKTGMKGYIPENILVYIAVHQKFRGRGLGQQLMRNALKHAQGDVALHVEPENPAKKLYERLGFENKYLEMRYIR